MIVIVGLVLVLGAVLTGFVMAGGQPMSLVHPSEIVTICGAAIGALIVMSPKKVLRDLLRGLVQSVKGTAYNKQAYEELFKVMYDLFRTARRDGLIALESHVSQPSESGVFLKYPQITANHHVTEFICSALSPVIEGAVKPDQLHKMLEGEIRLIEDEHHGPLGVLTKTADALPGFGIVAAVMGIVVTMGAIDGPVEQVGEKVGAALVGTFLGILLSYGFFAPLAVRMEFLGAAELAFFRTIATTIEGFVCDAAPKVALENARRGVSSEFRPDRERLDALLKEVEVS
ncbi:MAG: flagellar motor stator protein MotA [Thermoguttaceae bacterium]|jgi:chemotaxis protein MotA